MPVERQAILTTFAATVIGSGVAAIVALHIERRRHRNEIKRIIDQRAYERSTADEEASQRLAGARLMIARELATHLKAVQPISIMKQESRQLMGKPAHAFSKEESNAIWHFCVYTCRQMSFGYYDSIFPICGSCSAS